MARIASRPELCNIAATQPDFAARNPHVRRQKAHDGQHGDALARAGLADHPEHVIGRHIERNAVEQTDRPVRRGRLRPPDHERKGAARART